MRKKLAKLLVRLADKIYPEKVARIPQVNNYEASKIGLGLIISPEEIKKYAAKHMVSYSKASKELIAEAKQKVKDAIFLRIEKDSIIESKVSFIKGGTKIEGWLNIYAKEGSCRKKSVS